MRKYYSIYELLTSWGLRMLLVILSVILYINKIDNRWFLLFIVALAALINHRLIVLNKDHVELITYYFFGIFKKKKIIMYKEITKVVTSAKKNQDEFLEIMYFLGLPSQILFKIKTGKVITVKSYIVSNKLNIIVEELNNLIKYYKIN